MWSGHGRGCPAARPPPSSLGLQQWSLPAASLAADTGLPADLELSECRLRLTSGALGASAGGCGCLVWLCGVVLWDCSLGCGSIWTALLQAGLGGMCRLCLPGSHRLSGAPLP